jgi:hypothetical protein
VGRAPEIRAVHPMRNARVRVTPHLNLMDRLEAASNPARTPTVCELCITHRVLDVLVSHPRLDGPSVFASAYDAVHSRVNIKREIRTSDRGHIGMAQSWL